MPAADNPSGYLSLALVDYLLLFAVDKNKL